MFSCTQTCNFDQIQLFEGTNVVEVHMSRLRGKIDKGFATRLIHTVRGEGYVLRAE